MTEMYYPKYFSDLIEWLQNSLQRAFIVPWMNMMIMLTMYVKVRYASSWQKTSHVTGFLPYIQVNSTCVQRPRCPYIGANGHCNIWQFGSLLSNLFTTIRIIYRLAGQVKPELFIRERLPLFLLIGIIRQPFAIRYLISNESGIYKSVIMT